MLSLVIGSGKFEAYRDSPITGLTSFSNMRLAPFSQLLDDPSVNMTHVLASFDATNVISTMNFVKFWTFSAFLGSKDISIDYLASVLPYLIC